MLAWQDKGDLLADLGRPAEALVAFDMALALDPIDIKTLNKKGFWLNLLGRPDEALVVCEQTVALSLKDSIVWNNKGMALGMLGRYPDALEAHEQALEPWIQTLQCLGMVRPLSSS